MPEYLHFIWISAVWLGLLAMAEWMFHSLKVSGETTRNLVHAGTGLLVLFFPVCFQNQWFVLLICAMFQLIVALSFHYGYLKSINSLRIKNYGSIIYPMVVYLVYLTWYHSESWQGGSGGTYAYFYLPISIMALCDPLATFAGRGYPLVRFRKLHKSLGGTLVFWTGAFLLSCFILLSSHIFNSKDIIRVSFFLASISAVTELYSKKGLDNLFVPVVVLVGMYVAEYFF